MTSPSSGLVRDQVIIWLDEAGVPGADEDTAVSSLNLTWILHCYEDWSGRPAPTDDEAFLTVRTVADVVRLLDRQRA
ncbi:MULTISPECIES: hypothetical protein [Micromonospora]|uniref:hypothetical protein n=1 Tax=Micromonospora TaxID=1873 RepID=UPI00064B9D3D|nr:MULTISPECIES: hypothetical protein [Micromonospora]MDG4750879.1 hypothetical protein [Micromonospora sp. WMMD718]UFN96858.1 hypothetical protein LF814_12335 [Micromonospora aurantiaca]